MEEIKGTFGDRMANLVWAVTVGGDDRRTHVASIGEKIAAYPDAAVVKLADRIANVEASQRGDRHSVRYYREHPDFAVLIRPHAPAEMRQRYLQAIEARGAAASST